MTISVWNRKGGVGKSTASITLARMWHDRKPLVLDLDGQRSTHEYEAILEQFGVSIVDVDTSDFYGSGLPDAPLRIIDCPPDFDVAAAALEISDVIIVPFYADRIVWSATVEAWGNIADLGGKAQVLGLMNFYKPASWICRETLAKAQELMGDRLSKTIIRNREAMREADYKQLTVFDTAPDSPAAKQFRALGTELDQLTKK